MANHIFTVNEETFKVHLEYMFAGTWSWNWDEWQNHQLWALTDILAIKPWDNVLFYVIWLWFYWVFKIISFNEYSNKCVFYEYPLNQNFSTELNGKTLTYRTRITYNQIWVYKRWISEWDMIENPINIKWKSILNMQWSWIFKKLKANRWCLTIPDDEFNLMIEILKNNNDKLDNSFNYTFINWNISILNDNNFNYPNINEDNSNIEIYNNISVINQEIDLRKFFTFNSRVNNSLINFVIKWDINSVLNEIKCSFWDKSIDLLINTKENYCYLIELKNDFIYNESIFNQLYWYSRWISSYKEYQIIKPILILKSPKLVSKRKWWIYYKYLSEEDKNNNITSEWYNELINKLKDWKKKLKESWISNLEDLKVFLFETDENNNLTNFINLL